MDSEQGSVPVISSPSEGGTDFSVDDVITASDTEDPYSIGKQSVALLGLLVAIATIAIPLVAVLTDRLKGGETIVPTVLKRNGSKPTSPISFPRSSQSGS